MKKLLICLLIELAVVGNVLAGWNQAANMSTARDHFSAALIEDEIYVFGGNGNPDQLNLGCGEKYSISSNTWVDIADHPDYTDLLYPAGVEEICGAGLNGKFYVFGAWGDDPDDNFNSKNLNFNYVYDPSTDTWSQLADKPTLTAGPEIAVYNDKIYIFGGFGGDNETNRTEVEVYDPLTNSWQFVTNLPKQLVKPAVAIYQDKAYVIGGLDASSFTMSDEVMVYDFVSGSWTRNYGQMPANLIRAFGNATASPVLNGKVYLAGGFEMAGGEPVASSKVTVYDIAGNQWQSLEELPEARGNHASIIYDDTLYVMGGYAVDDDINRSKDTVFTYSLKGSPDIDGDEDVDLQDFAALAGQWLQSGCVGPDWCLGCDIDQSGDVGLSDLLEVVEHWLDGVEPPIQEPDITWVSINDPGFEGHEDFDGEVSKFETTNAQYCQYLNQALASGDIVINNGIVYGAEGSNLGQDSIGQVYFRTRSVSSYSQIEYINGQFYIISRDGYTMSDHPVVMVNWYGATAFCNYYGWRLPTQWEWAAIADYDGSYDYGCGPTIDTGIANCFWSNPLSLTDYPYTSPIGYYGAWGYNLCDMAGNVWEWTSSDSGTGCTLMGGGWQTQDMYCSVSPTWAWYLNKNSTVYDAGFRACR